MDRNSQDRLSRLPVSKRRMESGEHTADDADQNKLALLKTALPQRLHRGLQSYPSQRANAAMLCTCPCAIQTWWKHTSETNAGRLPSRQEVTSSFVNSLPLITRACLLAEYRGWHGLVAAASTREIMTFYPSYDDEIAFSRTMCHGNRAGVKPSLAFYQWLTSTEGPAWQLRGTVNLDKELQKILGDIRHSMQVTSTSLWGGSGDSRTPLHVDNVHAMILQVAGKKQFFMCSRSAVASAVEAERLPRQVLEYGVTENYCVLCSVLTWRWILIFVTGAWIASLCVRFARSNAQGTDWGDCCVGGRRLLAASSWHLSRRSMRWQSCPFVDRAI